MPLHGLSKRRINTNHRWYRERYSSNTGITFFDSLEIASDSGVPSLEISRAYRKLVQHLPQPSEPKMIQFRDLIVCRLYSHNEISSVILATFLQQIDTDPAGVDTINSDPYC